MINFYFVLIGFLALDNAIVILHIFLHACGIKQSLSVRFAFETGIIYLVRIHSVQDAANCGVFIFIAVDGSYFQKEGKPSI